jgi:hypothetical protein
MTLISAKCPSCQTAQELPPWAMLLEAGVDDGDTDTDATATWICGTCRQLVIKPIDLTALLNLLAVGVPLVAAEPDDAAVAHPEHVAAGPPLTFDELIDFHQSLLQQDADILAELGGDTDLCRDC